MADDNPTGGGKEKMLATLTKKYGPLPVWGWLVILVAIVAVVLYQRRGKSAANTGATDLNASGTSLEELTSRGGGMGGWGGGDTYNITYPVPQPAPNPGPTPPGPIRHMPRRDGPPRFPTPQDPGGEIRLPPRRRTTTVTTDPTPGGRRMSGPAMWIPR